jgi:hypothetical protein
MRSIKLIIKKLGSIRDSEIELMPMMLFSGESGLGKSYLAILCHYFFEIMANRKRIGSLFEKLNVDYDEVSSHFEENGIFFVLKKTDLEEWLAADAVDYLRYMLGNSSFEADFTISLQDSIPAEVPFSYKRGSMEINEKKEVIYSISVPGLVFRVGERGVNEESPMTLLLRFYLIQHILEESIFDLRTFVLPPSRGPVLTEDVTPVTGLYSSFNKCITWLKRVPNQSVERNQEFLALMEDVMEGEVIYDGEKFMYNHHTVPIPLSAAASSIRELAILSMIAERTELDDMVVLFEEPEAHLHPVKQRAMADALSLMNTFGAYMQVTTHSDYLLRRLNELIKLQKIKELVNNKEEYEKICHDIDVFSIFAFDYRRLGAYLLEKNPDGSSKIVRQSLEEGVPFSSFHEAIEKSLSFDQKLSDLLDEKNS